MDFLTPIERVQQNEMVFSDDDDDDDDVKTQKSDKEKNTAKDRDLAIVEIFDRDKLSYIVNNKELFENKRYYTKDSPFDDASRYLSTSIFGHKQVKFRQNKGYGRFWAIGPSLQNLPRFIRHPICKEYYDDLDIENSGPTILQYLCRIHKLACPVLDSYVSDRESFLNIRGFTREEAKMLYIKVINGGKPDDKFKTVPEVVNTLYYEIRGLSRDICREKSDEYHAYISTKQSCKYSNEGSYVSNLIYNVENMIIQTVIEFFGDIKYYVPCFDGILIEKGRVKKYDIGKCEQYIKDRLDIDITLKIKTMEEEIHIPDNIPAYEPAQKKYTDKVMDIVGMMRSMLRDEDVNNNTVSKLYCCMLGDDIKIIKDNGDGYKWSFKTVIWQPMTANLLIAEMTNEENLILAAIRYIIKDTKIVLLAMEMKIKLLEADIEAGNGNKKELQTQIKNINEYAKSIYMRKKQ